MTEDEKQEALRASILLKGFLKYDLKGVPRHQYYPEGSKENNFCREAMASRLRAMAQTVRGADGDLLETLAQQFEPNTSPLAAHGNLKIILKRRGGRKRPKDHLINSHIAMFIWKLQQTEGINNAVAKAVNEFQLGERRIWEIWGQYKKFCELFSAPL
jgi:hypothetical protein